MKKLLIILLALIPVVGKSQYLQVPTHYDSEHTAKHIINGHVKMYLTDSTKLVVEKKKDRYVTHCEVDGRDIMQRNLALRKIETKVHYKDPIQDLPAYQHCEGPDMLSASHALSRRCLSLPIYPELTDLEVEYVIDQLLDCVA